ncbi:MAG: type II toxin-antitoxin system PemK/MazF family toxin [Candidatus Staskawiczbacteria bacterium]|nr:type II toxin-antitoxin system PemK/MazF family toxin [Candidatus Staskawiczbacteria bacterium]
MKKDFKKWMEQKAKIHNDKIRPFFHEREVWFSSIGENVGFEQDGGGETFMRPALILKKFNNEVVWALPLTRTDKTGKYYFRISLVADDGNMDDRPSVVILSQLRLVDAKRLQYKVGTVKEDEFIKLKEALIALLK